MLQWSILLFIISSVQSVHFNVYDNQNSIFLLYPRLYLCNNGSFSFEFRTKTTNGILFYTYESSTDDSILISIVQGKLFVEQKFGTIQTHQQFDQSINDDKWYKIVFKRRSTIITEIVLYSVALRNVENRIMKSKILNYLPFTSLNGSSLVYIGGLPKIVYDKQRYSTEYLFSSYQGFVRNLRYGLCGCPERIQYPIFSSLSNSFQSEVCEQEKSLCSSSSCECLNVDEEPRYQCDCSNKTCHILTIMNKNLVQYQIDFTSVEYKLKSVASIFTFGTSPQRFHVQKSDHLVFTPMDVQQNSCMWSLDHCTKELTWTFILSISRFNTSTTVFSQYFKYDGILHINYIHLNSSSTNLHFDLWLPFNRGLLRTRLIDFPYDTPLYINLIYQSFSTLTVYLFGQLMDSTTKLISLPENKSTTNLSFHLFVQFQSISWSYDQTSFDCCAFLHNDNRLKRDLRSNLDTCQCKFSMLFNLISRL